MHTRPCPLLHKPLPQFLLQACLQGFLHHILRLNLLPCRPKWVFLVPTQTLDIGQRWVFSQCF